MADLVLIEEFGQFLIDEGVCRPWDTTGSLPMVIKDPRDGVPQPGLEGSKLVNETAVVGLLRSGEIPPAWLEEFNETALVKVIVRAHKSAEGELLQRQIKRLVVNQRAFDIGALRVQYCQQFAGVSPFASDELSYDTAQTLAFACRTKSLAGMPYAP